MNRKRITHLSYALVLGLLLFVLASCGLTATTGTANSDESTDRVANDAKLYTSYRTGDLENSSTYTRASIKQEANRVAESTRVLPVQLVGNNSNTVDLLLKTGDLPSSYLKVRLFDGKLKFDVVAGVVPEYALSLDVMGKVSTRSVPLIVVQSQDWTSFSGVSVEDSSGAQVNKNSDKDLSPVIVNVTPKGSFDPADRSGHLLLRFNGGVVPSSPDIYVYNSNEEAFSTDLYRNDTGMYLLVRAKVANEDAILKLESVENNQSATFVKVTSVDLGGGSNDTTPAFGISPAKALLYTPESMSGSDLQLRFTTAGLPAGSVAKLSMASGESLFQLSTASVAPDAEGNITFSITAGDASEFVSGKGTTLIATLYDANDKPLLSGGSVIVGTTEVRVVKVSSAAGSSQTVALDRSCGVGSYAFATVTGYLPSDTPSQVLSSVSSVVATDGTSEYRSFKLLDATVSPSTMVACLSASKTNPLSPGSTVDVEGKVFIDGFEVSLPHATIDIDSVAPPPPPPAVEAVLVASKGVVYMPNTSAGSVLSLTFDGSKLPSGAKIELKKASGNDLFDVNVAAQTPDTNGDVTFDVTALSGSDFVAGKKTVLVATVVDSAGNPIVKGNEYVTAFTKVRVVGVEPVLGTSRSDELNAFCGTGRYAFALVNGYSSDDTNAQVEGSVTDSQASTGSTSYGTVERIDTSTTPPTMVTCLDGRSLGQGITVSVDSSVFIDGVEVQLPQGSLTTPSAPLPPPPVITATLSANRTHLFLPTSQFGKDLDLVFVSTDAPSGSKVKLTKVSGDDIFSLGTSTLSLGSNGKVSFKLTALGESIFTATRKATLQAQLLDASNQPLLKNNATITATTEVRLLKVASVLDNAATQKALSAVCGLDSYAFAQVSGFYPTDTDSSRLAAISFVSAAGSSGESYSTALKLGAGVAPSSVIACVNDAVGNKLTLDANGDATINGAVAVDSVATTLPSGKIHVKNPPPPVTATLSADKPKVFLPSTEAGKVLSLSFTGANLPSGSMVRVSKGSGSTLFTFGTTTVTPSLAGKALFAGSAVSGSSFAGETVLKAELVDSAGTPIMKNGNPVVATTTVRVLSVSSVLGDATKQAALSGLCGTDSYAYGEVRGFAVGASSSDMLAAVSSVGATSGSGNTYSATAKTGSDLVVACVNDVSGNKLVLDSNGDATIVGTITVGGISVGLPSGKIHIATPTPPPPAVTATLSAGKSKVFLPTTEAGNVLTLPFSGTDLPSGSKVTLSKVSGDDLFTLGTSAVTPDSNGNVAFDVTGASGSSFLGNTVLKATLVDSGGVPVLKNGSPVSAITAIQVLLAESVLGDVAKQKALSSVCGSNSYAFGEVSGFASGTSPSDMLAAVSSVKVTGSSGQVYSSVAKSGSGVVVACVNDVSSNKLVLDASGRVVLNGEVAIGGISVTFPQGSIVLDYYIDAPALVEVSPGEEVSIPISIGGKYLLSGHDMKLSYSGSIYSAFDTPALVVNGVVRSDSGPIVFTVSGTARRGQISSITVYVIDQNLSSFVFAKTITVRVK